MLTDIAALRERIITLIDSGRTPVPPEPNLAALSRWSITAHQRHWANTRPR